MASRAIDEILTLNTLPTVLNRDVQGRLRRKMVVLKIERWLARNLCKTLGLPWAREDGLYQIDMSSTNPRFNTVIANRIGGMLPDLGEVELGQVIYHAMSTQTR